MPSSEGSSTRATASIATAIASAINPGRITSASAEIGMTAAAAITPAAGCEGIRTTAAAIAADHASASTSPG